MRSSFELRRTTRRALLAITAALLLTAGTGASASSALHPNLKKSSPAANDTIASAPREIRLWFSEKPELAVSSVVLLDSAGARRAVGKPHGDATDEYAIVADVPGALAPGSYRVDWRVLGRDGHTVGGSFGFTLRVTR